MISAIPKKPHQFVQNRNILILLSSDSERCRYVRLWVVNGYFVSSGQRGEATFTDTESQVYRTPRVAIFAARMGSFFALTNQTQVADDVGA